MPWKFVCDLWFHEVLQTTIFSQITKKVNKPKIKNDIQKR